MIVTKKYIQELKKKSRLNISEEMEKHILERLRTEPGVDEEGHTYLY